MVISPPRTFLKRSWKIHRGINDLLDTLRSEADVGLHLGAGNKRISNLINCDLFEPTADMKLDATALTTIENESVDLIETHHMIEHLSFSQTEQALAEWHRVLKSGGHLVITCPDFKRIVFKWIKANLWRPSRTDDSTKSYIMKMFYGPQEHEGMFHKNGFDRERIRALLADHGFEVVFTYTPYPLRQTPSLLAIARKI